MNLEIHVIRHIITVLKVLTISATWLAWYLIVQFAVSTVEMKIEWDPYWTRFLTLTIWGLGCAASIRRCIRIPGANNAIILYDPFFEIYPNIKVEGENLSLEWIHQEEVTEKLGLTFWWQSDYLPVDLTKDVTVDTDDNERYQTTDGDYITVNYNLTTTPLTGFLVNRTKYDEEEVRAKFKARVTRFFNKRICSTDADSVLGDFEHLQEEFEQEFGGPKKIDLLEMETGTRTDTPELRDIDRSQQTQDAHAALANAKLVKKMMDELSISEEEAWRQINIATGKLDARDYHIRGLPEGMQSFSWVAGQGGGGGGKGQKGQRQRKQGGGQGGNNP